MKYAFLVLASCSYTAGFAQVNYFTSDTVFWRVDSVTGEKLYVKGEEWFLKRTGGNHDTLTFTWDFIEGKSTARFEFDQEGECYFEYMRLSCGKWGGEDLFRYELVNNSLQFLADSFWTHLTGRFRIAEYSDSTIILIKEK